MSLSARRPRFSLGIVMVYIALVGVQIAPYLTGELREFLGLTLPYAAFGSLELGVLLAYRHLSRWIWVVIASLLVYPLFQLTGRQFMFEGQFYPALIAGWTTQGLFLVGLGMTFREVSRRLRAVSDAKSVEPGLVACQPLDRRDQGS